MRIEIMHLDGLDRGRIKESRDSVVRIGTDPAVEFRISRTPGVLPVHATLVVDGETVVLRPEGEVRLNRAVVGQVAVRDGDVLEIGPVALRLRLFPEDAVAHVRDVARGAAAAAGGTASRVAGPLAAIAFAFFFVLLVGGAYLGTRGSERRRALEESIAEEGRRHRAALHEQRRSYEGRIEKLTTELQSLEDRVPERTEIEASVGEVRRAVAEVQDRVLDRVTVEVARSIGENADLRAARDAVERVRRFEEDEAAAERIIRDLAPGVCLVQGAYAFGRVEDGKWRFLREAPADVRAGMADSGRVPLMLDGDGEIFRVEYTGTGFLADARGVVLTNRHIAEPWWGNDAARPLLEDGFEPRFLYLRAFFPEREAEVTFDPRRTLVSEEADLAALRFEPSFPLPKPLPLARKDRLAIGRRVLLLGYPSGLNALLARVDKEGAEAVTGGDEDWEPRLVLDQLAAKGMVRPLPTHGHIGDVLDDKIVFDAATAGGGSGAPLLDHHGEVVAVNYGILKAFSGANFGVPVKFARDLLRRSSRD